MQSSHGSYGIDIEVMWKVIYNPDISIRTTSHCKKTLLTNQSLIYVILEITKGAVGVGDRF